jgi:hypothetical protein
VSSFLITRKALVGVPPVTLVSCVNFKNIINLMSQIRDLVNKL